MGKPTAAQLRKINKFTAREMSEDEVYVFRPLMIDDQITAYSSRLHENLLKKMVKDANRGAALLMGHNNSKLPVGRTFNAELSNEDDNGVQCKSVYGEVYIDLGRHTESNMTTDDIAKGIDAGTIFDVSIGFNAEKWTCSICGNDVRDYRSCFHIPGIEYTIGENSDKRIEKCIVIAGDDGRGELLELSLVYAGACDRATIKNNLSNDSVREYDKGTKLSLVDDFKNIPLTAKIYQYYTKDGSVLFTDTSERTNGTEYLLKRSEDTDMDFTKISEKLGVTIASEDELLSKLGELSAELDTSKEELATKVSELDTIKEELTNATADIECLTTELAAKDEVITDLTAKNEELAKSAEVATTYRNDLTTKALELGVRAQGNTFQTDLFTKFLGTLSLDEIKGVISGFEAEVATKFEGARQSDGGEENLSKDKDTDVPDAEENPAEFSAYVADKAAEYAKENGVSIREASALMYKKYSNLDREDE